MNIHDSMERTNSGPKMVIPLPIYLYDSFPFRVTMKRTIFSRRSHACLRLLGEDTGDQASGDRAATLPQVEAATGLHSDGKEGLDDHFDVVTGHGALGLVFAREAHSGRDI